MIITIDGPVGTGKSTVAKKLAESIGYIFFDTGAMYRTFTYGILKHGIDLENKNQLDDFLAHFQFDIKVIQRRRTYFFEGENITDKIRTREITLAVSEIAAHPAVRERLTAIQRELSEGVNAVFEGRDMGTVVFPQATVKIFLTGRDEVRARRRFDELKRESPEENKNFTFEECLAGIRKRDTYDSNRQYAPLRQADDAYVIDTSDLTVDEVVYKILEHKDTLKTKRNSKLS